MALFLTQPTLYRLIQRELPEDVYPDSGDPSAYLSTADSAALAEVLANAYLALESKWNNFFPQTSDLEGIAQHEISRFGQLSIGLTLEQRQDRVLAKMRSLESMSIPDMTAIVERELPEGTYVTIVNWGSPGDGGTWFIGESELGFDTIFGGAGSSSYPLGTDLCVQDGSDIGLTEQEWLDARANAYTYEVRIYDYTPTDAEMEAIEKALTESEPSMADHVVVLKRSVLAPFDVLPSTTLHLVADSWDGATDWIDESLSGNDAAVVNVPTLEDSQQFYARKAIRADDAAGFHAPGDEFDATTQRTYEILIDDFGVGTQEFVIGRMDAVDSQIANWLYKNFAITRESAVYDSTGTAPWIGSDTYSSQNLNGLPVLFHIVIDAVARTIKVYENAVLIAQVNNPLFGTLATPTDIHLGIFGRWTQSGWSGTQFTGSILELLRHETVMDQDTITARSAEFNRLKGY